MINLADRHYILEILQSSGINGAEVRYTHRRQIQSRKNYNYVLMLEPSHTTRGTRKLSILASNIEKKKKKDNNFFLLDYWTSLQRELHYHSWRKCHSHKVCRSRECML